MFRALSALSKNIAHLQALCIKKKFTADDTNAFVDRKSAFWWIYTVLLRKHVVLLRKGMVLLRNVWFCFGNVILFCGNIGLFCRENGYSEDTKSLRGPRWSIAEMYGSNAEIQDSFVEK